jgi:hypothetical protein
MTIKRPKYVLICWKDIKDMVHADIVRKIKDSELLELENI